MAAASYVLPQANLDLVGSFLRDALDIHRAAVAVHQHDDDQDSLLLNSLSLRSLPEVFAALRVDVAAIDAATVAATDIATPGQPQCLAAIIIACGIVGYDLLTHMQNLEDNDQLAGYWPSISDSIEIRTAFQQVWPADDINALGERLAELLLKWQEVMDFLQ